MTYLATGFNVHRPFEGNPNINPSHLGKTKLYWPTASPRFSKVMETQCLIGSTFEVDWKNQPMRVKTKRDRVV